MSNLREQAKRLTDGALTVPNALSLVRIILVPVFLVLFLKGSYLAAIIVVAVSGLTDFLDGKIARRFNQISNLGKLLDPLADKLTQMTIAIAFFFAYHGAEDSLLRGFSWIFWFYVAKELLMVVGSVVMLSVNIIPGAAIIYGKVATFVYYLVMLLLLICSPVFGLTASFGAWTLPSVVVVILVSISAVLTLIAFISYMPDILRQVKEHKANKADNKE